MIVVERKSLQHGKSRQWSFYVSNVSTVPTLVLASFRERCLKTKSILRDWDHNSLKPPAFDIPFPKSLQEEAVTELNKQICFDVAGHRVNL